MGLQDTLKGDMKAAMKARDQVRLTTVRLLLADMKNQQIAKGRDLNEKEELALLTKHAKQRREAIEAFSKGGRDDLVAEEQGQLEVIKGYLPDQLDEAAVRTLVDEIVAATGASSMKDMGRVMGQLMPKIKGRFDGSAARKFVEAALKGG